jgi:hypothetical protein
MGTRVRLSRACPATHPPLPSPPPSLPPLFAERYWGGEDYVIGLRQTLDAAGFTGTKIVIPDGGGPEAIVTAAAANSTFRDAIDVVGLHYPCNHPCPTVESEIGKDYWASEDYSTVADWAGAGCWGRLLSQNYVRMNMTSTISWSLIWSVYPELPYYGNGLMYAYSPWSGNYMGGGSSPGVPNAGDILNGPIWTSAHTTQFVEVGWRYLHVPGGGSGMLPGGNGGSYVTLVPPTDLSGLTIVVEKLEGKCLRCAGETTAGETVTFQTGGGLVGPGTVLHVWRSNQTVQFWRDADVTIAADSTFSVYAPADSIVTLSTTATASKGQPSAPIPAAAPFPLPYADDFSSYAEDGMAKYFADQAGSFAVRSGKLTQVVPVDPGANAWVSDPDPVSLIGDGGMTDFAVSAEVVFSASAPPTLAGTAAPVIPRKTIDALFARSGRRGEILDAIAAAADGTVSSSSSSSSSSAPAGPGDISAAVAPCDSTSPFQRWFFNAPESQYLSNTFSKAAAPLCLNVPGCDSTQPLIYYACVNSGGSCCGADCYKGLQFALAGPTNQPQQLQSLLDQLCVAVTPGGGVVLADCKAGAANGTWLYDATTGLLQVANGGGSGSNLCLTTPQQITTYTQVCGRITGYSGFVRAAPTGYCLVLSDDGAWVARAGGTTLAKGVVPSGAGGFNSTTPHTLTLTMKGKTISGAVDASPLFSIPSDATYSSGYAAVGSGFHAATFDNFNLLTV